MMSAHTGWVRTELLTPGRDKDRSACLYTCLSVCLSAGALASGGRDALWAKVKRRL